jgi:hypothetical protein
MSIDALLSRLDGVKQTGPARWIAKCPSHADKSPSLAIRELDDGRVLLHCFAGCETPGVLAALGLDMNDLFPEGAKAHHAKPERRPFPAADILRAVSHELLVAANIAASALPEEHPSRARLVLAAARVGAAASMGGLS